MFYNGSHGNFNLKAISFPTILPSFLGVKLMNLYSCFLITNEACGDMN